MINSKLDFAYKARWGAASFQTRDRMVARTLHMFSHFLAGVALVIFLLPEGAAIVLGSLALVVAMKALYDYVDTGALKLGCAAAMVAGGLVSMGISQII